MKITRKLLMTAVFILSAAFNLFSQNHIILVKSAENNLWGYANLKGEIVIPSEYKRCYSFCEGLAVVLNEKTGKFNIITPTGKKIETEIDNFEVRVHASSILGPPIGPTMGVFTDIGFCEGLLAIHVREKWGFMDSGGKVIVEPQYEFVTNYNGGYAVAMKKGDFYILDKKGNVIVPDERVRAIKYFAEGLAPYTDKGRDMGFVDCKGKVVIEPKFQSVGHFNDGLAWAKSLENKVGFINKAGEWVVQPKFQSVGLFNDGLAWAKTFEGKVGFINKSGEWVILPIYKTAKDFDIKSGLAVVKTEEAGAFYINKEGKVQNINPSDSFHEFNEGLCLGKKDPFVGFYDATGKWVVQPKLEAVRSFKNGYVAAKMNDKWGIIDSNGNWIIEPKFATVKEVEIY